MATARTLDVFTPKIKCKPLYCVDCGFYKKPEKGNLNPKCRVGYYTNATMPACRQAIEKTARKALK